MAEEKFKFFKERYCDPNSFRSKLKVGIEVDLWITTDNQIIHNVSEEEFINEATEFFKQNLIIYSRKHRVLEKLKKI